MNNFLSIVWYRVLPARYGGQKGIAHFNSYLGKKVPLTCLCSRDNLSPGDLTYQLNNTLPISRLQPWNPFTRNKIIRLIREEKFTNVIIEHPWHGWLGRHKKKYGFRFIVHAHNIEFLRMKAKKRWGWQILRRSEARAFALADHILFKSHAESESARLIFRIPKEKILIVPYGTGLSQNPRESPLACHDVRNDLRIAPGEKLLLFAGSFDYTPNIEALDIIHRELVPRLRKIGFRFRLVICGQLSEQRRMDINREPDMLATGFVDSIDPFLQTADVFINPVMRGSGIQTKNLDAIANGCSVVGSSFAARGLPSYLLKEKLFVSGDRDWDLFCNDIIAACSSTAQTPQQFYKDHYWENVVAKMLEQLSVCSL